MIIAESNKEMVLKGHHRQARAMNDDSFQWADIESEMNQSVDVNQSTEVVDIERKIQDDHQENNRSKNINKNRKGRKRHFKGKYKKNNNRRMMHRQIYRSHQQNHSRPRPRAQNQYQHQNRRPDINLPRNNDPAPNHPSQQDRIAAPNQQDLVPPPIRPVPLHPPRPPPPNRGPGPGPNRDPNPGPNPIGVDQSSNLPRCPSFILNDKHKIRFQIHLSIVVLFLLG